MGNTLLAAASLLLGLSGSWAAAAEATPAVPLAVAQTLGTSSEAAVTPATEPAPQRQLTNSTGGSVDSVALRPAPSESRRQRRIVALIGSFTIFLLAVFVGFEIITKVPPTLHTPLMSGSNAISGITIVGAILTAGHAAGGFGSMLGMLAVILASINVAGGFLVTHRMLKMFKKR